VRAGARASSVISLNAGQSADSSEYYGGYRLTAVTTATGTKLAYTINGTMMRVELGAPLPPRATRQLRIDWNYKVLPTTTAIAQGNPRSGQEFFPRDGFYKAAMHSLFVVDLFVQTLQCVLGPIHPRNDIQGRTGGGCEKLGIGGAPAFLLHFCIRVKFGIVLCLLQSRYVCLEGFAKLGVFRLEFAAIAFERFAHREGFRLESLASGKFCIAKGVELFLQLRLVAEPDGRPVLVEAEGECDCDAYNRGETKSKQHLNEPAPH
jgi:hypothetical protein